MTPPEQSTLADNSRTESRQDQTQPKKVFIKTFGCQMNEYDSARMSDLLSADKGMIATDDPEQADVILLNTCSVREKAEDKVYSHLGRFIPIKERKPDLVIGVGGCVASQEGDNIVKRAPYVDLVFGPQTLHRLPEMIEARQRSGRSQVDISFPEIEKFDHLPPPRVEGAAAFLSVMEGCSKYCTFCVVPYTRGEEVSRPFEDVLTEAVSLAQQGVREIGLRHADRIYRRDSGNRTHPLHHLASERNESGADRLLRQHPETGVAYPLASAVRLGSHPDGDEAQPHGATVQIHHPQTSRGSAGHLHRLRLHRRLPGRDRGRFRSHPAPDGRRRL